MNSIGVLLVTTELGIGGAEKIVFECATGMDQERFSPGVAALNGRGAYADMLRDAGIPVFDLGMRHWWHMPCAIQRLRRILRENHVRLVHAHLFHADLIARLATPATIPVISTTHIAEARNLPWRFRIDQWTGARCACRTAVSSAAAIFQETKLRLPAHTITVIPNGIDLTHFQPAPDRNIAKKELGLDPTRPVVSALGRFDPQKGLDRFIDTAALLNATHPEIQWLLAGYGREEEALRARIVHLNLTQHMRVIVSPASTREIYAATDVFVFPSRYEGFGLTLVEAMACGCAVVASDIETSREILHAPVSSTAEAPMAGILIPEGDPTGMAQAITGLLAETSYCTSMGEKARVRAQHFSRAAMLQSYEQLYTDWLPRTT